MAKPRFVFTLSCKNRPGIVAGLSNFLFQSGGDIREAQQFDDAETGKFFARVAFDLIGETPAEDVAAGLHRLGDEFGAVHRLSDHQTPRRVLIMVSKLDHCLVDLLYRWRIGELTMTPVGIISNHAQDQLPGVDFAGLPFHHLPISRESKMEQEAQVYGLVKETKADLVVLARYMQVLSDALAAKLAGRCINIHHSFLPGFKGARPYHQAHSRGVKLIGATAHYVTTDLDEGPIIEQDVERITHADTPEDLIRKGRDIERRVLARAVRYHLEDRVLLNGAKTVVFTG